MLGAQDPTQSPFRSMREIAEERAINAQFQDLMNAEFAGLEPRQSPFDESAVLDALRHRLLFRAQDQFRGYSQYDGYWDNWVVIRILRKWEGKGGVAAEPGDYALFNPEKGSIPPGGMWPEGTFFSNRLGWNCGLMIERTGFVVL